MSDRLPLEVTALAARHIRKAEKRWRANRQTAPNAVRQELERAFALITVQPRIGSRAASVKLPVVRRIFMPIITYHPYYRLLSDPDRVEVVALWHSRRGEGPPI